MNKIVFSISDFNTVKTVLRYSYNKKPASHLIIFEVLAGIQLIGIDNVATASLSRYRDPNL